MEPEEKMLSEKRKRNMKLYSYHKMLTTDLLFYYGIKFLFLTQIKGLTAGDIVLASAFWGIFKVLFQIPMTTIIDKLGNRKGLIIADLTQAISVILVMASNNFQILILANVFGAIAHTTKEVAEAGLLNQSIPEGENKGQIYSKIEGKGIGNYYYLSAVSAILSGILFDINGYIPMAICVITVLVATLIASKFENIKIEKTINVKENSNIKEKYRTYFKDLKLAFSFIFNSRRLKALMIYSGVMYGIILVMNTYEMGLLDEIEMSATGTGIVYAAMQIVAGIASKQQNKFHNKYKNKTLSVIGISYVLAILIAGVASIVKLPHFAIIAIIVVTYVIRYLGTGQYYVLIKKYLTNFTNVEVANKVYSAHGLVTGIGNTIICALGSTIVSHNSIKHSMIIFGLVFLAIMVVVLNYMKTRIGLEPTEYRKKDINYKEYISVK